jgi:hypothetical protein
MLKALTPHKLTKSRIKAWHPCLHFVSISFCSESLKSGNDGTDNVFFSGNENYPQGTAEPHGMDRSTMRTSTYNDEAVPWSRSNHSMGTRLLPSSDESINFSGIPHKRIEIMINQTTLCLGLLNYVYLSPRRINSPNVRTLV